MAQVPPTPAPEPPAGLRPAQWGVMVAIVALMALGAWLGVRHWLAPRPLRDWPMTDSRGQRVTWSTFRGQWLIVYFGFTGCPEACPTGLTQLASALRELGPLDRKVQVVMVTVDPQRDTPALLASYLPYFDRSFLGIHPAPSAIAEVMGPFGARFERRPTHGGYTIDHTLSFYVVDPGGHLKTSFLLPLPPGALRRMLTR